MTNVFDTRRSSIGLQILRKHTSFSNSIFENLNPKPTLVRMRLLKAIKTQKTQFSTLYLLKFNWKLRKPKHFFEASSSSFYNLCNSSGLALSLLSTSHTKTRIKQTDQRITEEKYNSKNPKSSFLILFVGDDFYNWISHGMLEPSATCLTCKTENQMVIMKSLTLGGLPAKRTPTVKSVHRS